MALTKIQQRQNDIRRWWLTHALNPSMLKLASTRWNNVDIIERWMDMQARCACAQHGRIVNSDARWAIILEQLKFPPLWLLQNMHATSARKRYKAMLTQYHVVVREEGRWLFKPDSTGDFSISIEASDANIYEWLGLVGGVLRAVDPDIDDAALTSLNIEHRGNSIGITPVFNPDTTEYSVDTRNFVAHFIYVIARHHEAMTSTVLSADFRTATVTVTAADRSTTKVYTLRASQ